MRLIRVTLTKKGRAKYLSHLDMQRCMMRAVRRAGIDLWYTEGFNPRPYITFALPLPLGAESECEPVDIKLNGEMTDTQVLNALSPTLPEGIEVLSVGEAHSKPSDIAFAEYRIVVYSNQQLGEKIKAALASGNLPVEKPGKAGRKKTVRQINAAELVHSHTVEIFDCSTEINAVLAAGSAGNLSPLLLLEALSAAVGEKLEYISVVRKALLLNDFQKFS